MGLRKKRKYVRIRGGERKNLRVKLAVKKGQRNDNNGFVMGLWKRLSQTKENKKRDFKKNRERDNISDIDDRHPDEYKDDDDDLTKS